MKISLHKVAELTGKQRTALAALSLSVYPPDEEWEGRFIEWAAAQWCVVCWNNNEQAMSYAGAIIRQGTLNNTVAKIGGVGGVKTHPAARQQGLASQVIEKILDFFKEQKVDFALLVCKPELIAFYERIGWQPYSGSLLATQRGKRDKFTFNLPMTHPVCVTSPAGGTIDLMGLPW